MGASATEFSLASSLRLFRFYLSLPHSSTAVYQFLLRAKSQLITTESRHLAQRTKCIPFCFTLLPCLARRAYFDFDETLASVVEACLRGVEHLSQGCCSWGVIPIAMYRV